MPILTANINFLASLGITTSEQFTAAFGDMADFTEYCTAIGYSWELDENNDIVLITPNGNKVNTYVPAEEPEKTATPEIVVTPGDTEYTFAAIGDGDVKLYIDETEVSNPVAISRTSEDQEITVTATAQEQGKQISDEAVEEVTIPALSGPTSIQFDSASYSISGVEYDPGLQQNFTITDNLGNDVTNDCTITLYPANTGIIVTGDLIDATAMSEGLYHITMTATYGELTATSTIDADIAALPITATPTISYTQGLTAYTITATGDGTVLLYADGTAVQNPCSISRTTTAQTITFTATAQETGKQISATATEVINIPAMEVTPTPVITYDSTTFTVDVTGNGTVLAYVDGVQTQMPHTFTQGASDITYVVTATAQEQGKQISATATENCLVPAAVIKDYMKLSVLNESGNDGDITITIPAAVTSSQATSLSYSKDGSNWTDTTVDSTAQTITIPVNAGDEVYLKGIANQWTNTRFTSSVNFNVSGNVMSLFYSDNFENQTSFPANSTYNLAGTFTSESHLINAGQLELPATTLSAGCYQDMFSYCRSLTTAPSLPATTLADSCYYNMFNNCTSLTTAPALPATTLTGDCYMGMFNNCTSLTTAPALPATTLATRCYKSMFNNCTSLTTAPALPATTLTGECYSNMFSGCRSLTTAPVLNTTTLAQECYVGMFNNCTSLTTAPSLPATTLVIGCYGYMFEGCRNLNSITMLAEDISAANCLNNWVQNVASTGTFTKSANMTALPAGNSGIPTNWTVVDYTP